MNDKPEIKPQGVSPLKHICMTIGELPTSYLETMSYYEMLVWFTKFLQEKMIPALDNNALAVEELQRLFNELQSYVNNYFDNLDIQDEIDNKLDEMAEDGTLQEIIADYLNSKAIFGFNTVADMKEATNLIAGSYAKTFGYYEINDGGGADYIIVDDESLVDNGATVHVLNSGLRAIIVVNESISLIQMGYKPNTPAQDCHDSIEQYVNLCNRDNKKYKLIIPSGIWAFSETNIYNSIHYRMGVWIEGLSTNFSSANNDYKDSVIIPYNDNQEYIWNMGISKNSTTIVGGNTLKNLVFSTKPAISGYTAKFCETALLLTYCCYSHFDNIYFHECYGTGLTIRIGFENYFGYMNFRGVGYITPTKTYHAWTFEHHPIQGMASGVSAMYVDYINFEGWCGSAIYIETGATVVHCEINNIQAEWNIANNHFSSDYTLEWTQDADTKNITWDKTDSNIEHMYLIKGSFATNYNGLQVNTISISGCNRELYTLKSNGSDIRYLVRSGVIGPTEYYEDNRYGLNIVCSKMSLVSRNKTFPVFHAVNLYGFQNIECRLGIVQGTIYPFCIGQTGNNNVFTISKSLNPTNYTEQRIYFGERMPSNASLSSLNDGSGYNNLVGRGIAGGLVTDVDSSKALYLKIYVDYDTTDEMPDNIQINCVITRNNNTVLRTYCVNIPKLDFVNETYPLKEWFTYCVTDYQSQYYPFNKINYEIYSRNEHIYMDYLIISEDIRKMTYSNLSNTNVTNFSKVGALAYCTDKRIDSNNDYGLLCIFNGTEWTTLDGTSLASL